MNRNNYRCYQVRAFLVNRIQDTSFIELIIVL